MTGALALLLLVAFQDPAIHEVRTITDGYARSGCWLPLKIRVGGPAGFEGEIVASADAGFRVVRPLRIPASGVAEVVVPVVVLGKDARVEVRFDGPSGTVDRRAPAAPLKFLDRERLVLIDPLHPECEALRAQDLSLQKGGAPIVIAVSDPADWNEAADMGAFEAVDAVVAADETAVELAMYTWRALSGGVVTQPRRDLLTRLEEPAARFPSVDATVGRYTVSDRWIPRKRDATLLFVVVYGFGFFVAVYVTWSRKGGVWLILVSAAGASALFVAAFAAFYPKGNLAVRTWQGIVDAPETPVAISICALWGSGDPGDLEFGRVVKPVHPTFRDASLRDLELRRTPEGRWRVRGASPGDSTRFVTVERLSAIDPFTRYVDEQGRGHTYRPEESSYFLRLPRKRAIALQNPETGVPAPVTVAGLVESRAARVFRIEVQK